MSIEINVEVTGWEALFEAVGQLESKSLHAGGDALVALGRRIVEVIKEHYVPVDVGMEGKSLFGVSPMVVRIRKSLQRGGRRVKGGTLRNSVGSDSIAKITTEGVEVTIYAGKDGSGAEAYAAVQHENLTFRHMVGQAKYIEIPVMLIATEEMAPEIVKTVSMAMEGAWGRSGVDA